MLQLHRAGHHRQGRLRLHPAVRPRGHRALRLLPGRHQHRV